MIYLARSSPIKRLKLLGRHSIFASKYALYPLVRLMSGKRSFNMFSNFWFFIGMLEWTLGRQTFNHD